VILMIAVAVVALVGDRRAVAKRHRLAAQPTVAAAK
jgi:hypothetical protein